MIDKPGTSRKHISGTASLAAGMSALSPAAASSSTMTPRNDSPEASTRLATDRSSASVTGSGDFDDVLAISAWLVALLAALAAGAARVPLWSRDTGGSQSSLALMLGAQVVLGSMLLPTLVRTWRAALAVGVTSIVFAQLAAVLAGPSFGQLALAGAYTALWLFAVMVAGIVARQSRGGSALVSAVATMWCLGGALALHLGDTWGSTSLERAPALGVLVGPLHAVLDFGSRNPVDQPPSHALSWLAPPLFLAAAIVFSLVAPKTVAGRAG